MAEATPFVKCNELHIAALRRLSQKPPLFASHEELFWDDPHISTQMLKAHLNPDWEAASRPHAVIDKSVDWMLGHLGLSAGQKVLDLGCGPGLYCIRLHHAGLRVTGMDFSRNSIAYAQRYARDNGLDIEYVCGDYLSLERESEFNAVFLIYLDFCVLSDRDRDELLRRIYRALKPNGAFVFDVATPNRAVAPEGTTRWQASPGGFWKSRPYLELAQYFTYPDADADVEQTIVIEENGKISVYRVWNRGYTADSIAEVLKRFGLSIDGIWRNLVGEEYDAGAETMGVIARKPLD